MNHNPKKTTRLLYLHSAQIDKSMANLHQVIHMCNAFKANGVEVCLSLSGDDMPPENVLEKLRLLYGEINFSIAIRKKIISQMADDYLFKSNIRRSIAEQKPDVIFCRSHLYLKPCIDSGIPVIFESHDANLHLRLKWLDNYWKKYIAKVALQNNRFLMISISAALRGFWVDKGIPAQKIITLHDGFDPKMFAHEISKEQARKKIGIDQIKKVVTYTGSLYPNREIENILEMAESFPEVLFLVVGGPEEQKTHYEDLAREKGLNNMLFTGRVAHKSIPLYLFASDILLGLWSDKVRTINYCSPLKVFEYMAAGRLIVAHGFPTIKEILRHNENAFIADPADLTDLKIKLNMALISADEHALVAAAQKEALSLYTWNDRAKRIIEFYHSHTF